MDFPQTKRQRFCYSVTISDQNLLCFYHPDSSLCISPATLNHRVYCNTFIVAHSQAHTVIDVQATPGGSHGSSPWAGHGWAWAPLPQCSHPELPSPTTLAVGYRAWRQISISKVLGFPKGPSLDTSRGRNGWSHTSCSLGLCVFNQYNLTQLNQLKTSPTKPSFAWVMIPTSPQNLQQLSPKYPKQGRGNAERCQSHSLKDHKVKDCRACSGADEEAW